jgi:hypothetical protein
MRILLVDLMAWSFMSSASANVRKTFEGGLLNEELVVDLIFRMNEAGASQKLKVKPRRSREWYHLEEQPSTEKKALDP